MTRPRLYLTIVLLLLCFDMQSIPGEFGTTSLQPLSAGQSAHVAAQP